MKSTILFLLLTTCVLAQQQPDIPWTTLMQSQTPMLKMHPTMHGRTAVTGPQTSANITILPYIKGIFSGPIADAEDNLYFGTYRNPSNFLKFSTASWDTVLSKVPDSLNDIFSSAPLLGADGAVYFASEEGIIYALNSDFTLRWSVETGQYFGPRSGMNIDLQGNVYVNDIDGEIYCINSTGNIEWIDSIAGGFDVQPVAFSPDGNTFYAAGLDSNLYALDLQGKEIWHFRCGNIDHSPVVDAQGNIYIRPIDELKKFYSLFPDGTIRWEVELPWSWSMPSGKGIEFPSAPVLDKEGNVTVIGPGLLSYNWDGTFRWQNTLDNDEIWQPLICDDEGTIYCGSSGGGKYFAVSNQGITKWTIDLNGYQVDNTGAFLSDGTFVFSVHGVDGSNALWFVSDEPLSADEGTTMPGSFSLRQNYPNPFNPSTVITYTLPERTDISLIIYDVLGSEVAVLATGEQDAGTHSVVFNAANFSSGVYYYTLTAGGFRTTQKMMLVK